MSWTELRANGLRLFDFFPLLWHFSFLSLDHILFNWCGCLVWVIFVRPIYFLTKSYWLGLGTDRLYHEYYQSVWAWFRNEMLHLGLDKIYVNRCFSWLTYELGQSPYIVALLIICCGQVWEFVCQLLKVAWNWPGQWELFWNGLRMGYTTIVFLKEKDGLDWLK